MPKMPNMAQAEVQQSREEGTALRLAGLAADDDRTAQRAKLAAATEEQHATALALATEQAEAPRPPAHRPAPRPASHALRLHPVHLRLPQTYTTFYRHTRFTHESVTTGTPHRAGGGARAARAGGQHG